MVSKTVVGRLEKIRFMTGNLFGKSGVEFLDLFDGTGNVPEWMGWIQERASLMMPMPCILSIKIDKAPCPVDTAWR
jgi:hypothetical protein